MVLQGAAAGILLLYGAGIVTGLLSRYRMAAPDHYKERAD